MKPWGHSRGENHAVRIWRKNTASQTRDHAPSTVLQLTIGHAPCSFKKSNGGKFLAGGDAPSGADCKAAPFLLHAAVALPHFNKMDPIFASYPSLQAYMSQLDALDAYKQSKYPDDVIIAGWAAKLA